MSNMEVSLHRENALRLLGSHEVAYTPLGTADSPSSQSAQFSDEKSERSGRAASTLSLLQRRRTGRRRSAWSYWTFELLSIMTSVGALLAIVGIMFAYNGKPMSHWHFALQPSTVISALSTLSKTSMLMVVGQGLGQLKWQYFSSRPRQVTDMEYFDGASHGPLGSLELLYNVNKRAVVASVGALIVILALAMDPFVQQVIYYDGRVVEAHNITASTRAARQDGLGPNEYEDPAYNTTLENRLMGAMYAGVCGTYDQVPLSCPSGHCSWPYFESLGFQSTCDNVTLATNRTQTCGSWGEYAPPTEMIVMGTIDKRQCMVDENGVQSCATQQGPLGQSNCTYRLPSGTTLMGVNQVGITGNNQHNYLTLWNSSVRYSVADDTGFSVAAVLFDEDYPREGKDAKFSLKEAWQCTIRWSAKGYDRTKVERGNATDVPTSITPLFGSVTSCNRQSNTITEDGMIPLYKPDDGHLACGESVESGHEQAMAKAFLVNQNDLKMLFSTLESILATTFTAGDNTNIGAALYKARSLPEAMNRIAVALTDVVRHGPYAEDVQGTVYESQQHIHVRWPWLILPAALVFGALTFLAVTITMPNEHGAVWKTSALPSLFHGLSGWHESDLRYLSIEEMEQKSRGMWVRLSEEDDNLRLLKRGTTSQRSSLA